MGKFDGKVVLISGGARGQGRSHAVSFAREGADVAVFDSVRQFDSIKYAMPTSDDLDETVRQVESLGRRCVSAVADVRDLEGLESFTKRVEAELGPIDFVLANAGIMALATFAEMTPAEWQETIDINLTGVFNTFRAALPSMIERQTGSLVVTSSMMGKKGGRNLAAYAATKWGVIGLAKTLAIEVADQGITVNVVCPGNVNTPLLNNEAVYNVYFPDQEIPGREEIERAFAMTAAQPVPYVESSDISEAIMFLCSDAARHITGETLSVAAGGNASNAG